MLTKPLNRLISFIKNLFSRGKTHSSPSELPNEESEEMGEFYNKVHETVEKYPIPSNPNDPSKKTARKASKQI